MKNPTATLGLQLHFITFALEHFDLESAVTSPNAQVLFVPIGKACKT